METANTAGRGYFIQKQITYRFTEIKSLSQHPAMNIVITLKSVQNQHFSDLLLFLQISVHDKSVMAKVKEIMVLANYLWFRFYGNKAQPKSWMWLEKWLKLNATL